MRWAFAMYVSLNFGILTVLKLKWVQRILYSMSVFLILLSYLHNYRLFWKYLIHFLSHKKHTINIKNSQYYRKLLQTAQIFFMGWRTEKLIKKKKTSLTYIGGFSNFCFGKEVLCYVVQKELGPLLRHIEFIVERTKNAHLLANLC